MNKKLLLLSSFLAITSCGGSSGSSSDNNQANQTVLEGVFIDSPVSGLTYSTATQSGVTDSSGTFTYLAGETVSFNLGGVELGVASGSNEITPLDLVGAATFDEATQSQRQELTNILIFLQSLDADQNPDNGIDLADLDQQLVSASIDFGMPVEEFTSGPYLAVLEQSAGRLVDETLALNHFFESTDATINLELPVLRQADFDGDGTIDSETVYEYTVDGLPETITNTSTFSGITNTRVQSYEYEGDLLVNLISRSIETDGTSSLTAEQSFEYNDQGQLENSVLIRPDQPTASLTRTYDDFGRLATQELQTPSLAVIGTPIVLGSGVSRDGTPFANVIPPEGAFAAFQIGPNDVASIFAAFQIPLDLSVPSLFGDAVFIGNFPPTFTGIDIRLQQFEYSDLGYVNQVIRTESTLLEGETETLLQSVQTQTYDAQGRLLSSVGQALDFQIESFFSFADNGRLNSCSVAVETEVLIENTDPITSPSADNEQYTYIGNCSNLIGQLFRLDENGDPAVIEIFSPAMQIPPFFEIPARVSRQEISFTDSQNFSIRAISDIQMPDQFSEQIVNRSDNRAVITSQNSLSEQSSIETITFESFELPQLPREQITLSFQFELF